MRAQLSSIISLTIVLLFAVAGLLVMQPATGASVGDGWIGEVSLHELASSLLTAGAQATDFVYVWLVDHYQRAPTLLLGLATLILFPIVSIISAALRTVSQSEHQIDVASISEPTEQHRTAGRRVMPVSDRVASTAGKPVWPSKAIVELRDPTGRQSPARFQLAQPVVQIGRSDDVDIVIPDPTVHRHHATIHCTEDAEYLVTDLGAGTGNGVVVNGHPVLQHQIFNGDEIRLGRARLTFITAQT